MPVEPPPPPLCESVCVCVCDRLLDWICQTAAARIVIRVLLVSFVLSEQRRSSAKKKMKLINR